jgi:hypothetical protein
MTCFATPEFLNRRLSNYEYISHPADIEFFAALIRDIRKMERHGDNLTKLIPEISLPHAWSRAYRIYEALKQRDEIPPDPAIAEEKARHAAREADWNRFINQRVQLLEFARQGRLDNTMALYLGLKPGDLDSPTTNDPDAVRSGGRHPDWQERASRIDDAIGAFEALSPAEKAAIPQIMSARRAEASAREAREENARLADRIAELEAVTRKAEVA